MFARPHVVLPAPFNAARYQSVTASIPPPRRRRPWGCLDMPVGDIVSPRAAALCAQSFCIGTTMERGPDTRENPSTVSTIVPSLRASGDTTKVWRRRHV